MKNEILIKLIGCIAIAMSVIYAGCYVQDNEVSHTYETDDTSFKNGEILLPDYVHTDTLIVVDAKFLNECMQNYDIASDGDINDVLRTTTKKY